MAEIRSLISVFTKHSVSKLMSLLMYSSATELIGLIDDIHEKFNPIFRENEQICHII